MEINKRLLIVDDNAAIHDDFRKILCPTRMIGVGKEYAALEHSLFEDSGVSDNKALNIEYEMDFAFQGEEALHKVLEADRQGNPYAVVFTDVRMPPGFDGVQLVGQLLRKAPYTEVVIVTAFSDYTWEEMTEKFGWTDRLLFLRKPFDVITVRQIALTLTKKWSLGAHARALTQAMEMNLAQLEMRVEERTAKLVQANKDLQNFAYIVSHDLNSPLLSIQGFVGELRLSLREITDVAGDLMSQLEPEQQIVLQSALRENIPEALDFIDTSATKMDSLIKAILKLSRLGYRELSFEPIDMEELIDQNLKALAYPIEKSRVQVKVMNAPKIVTDRLTMEQIFGNLLSNAVKYLDPKRPGRIEIDSEPSENGVIFHIRDNGSGISPGDLPHIFDIFQRGGSQEVPGEGMGLAFVKTLIKHIGGRIWCNSEPGKGATFSFLVPRAQ